jgi:hypothetical protein
LRLGENPEFLPRHKPLDKLLQQNLFEGLGILSPFRRSKAANKHCLVFLAKERRKFIFWNYVKSGDSGPLKSPKSSAHFRN